MQIAENFANIPTSALKLIVICAFAHIFALFYQGIITAQTIADFQSYKALKAAHALNFAAVSEDGSTGLG